MRSNSLKRVGRASPSKIKNVIFDQSRLKWSRIGPDVSGTSNHNIVKYFLPLKPLGISNYISYRYPLAPVMNITV